MKQYLENFVSAFHPAAPGSNPEQSTYALVFRINKLLYLSLNCEYKKQKGGNK